MMQWNPAQKLTDGVFRGFWIRERAHFHPVGQSPGGEKRRTERGGGRKGCRQVSETGSER